MKKITVLEIQQFESAQRKKEFYSNTLENHLLTAHKNIHKPHKHNFYLTVLFTHGNGIHEIDFNKYPIQAGSLFFLNPGQIHHWILSEDIKGYIFFHTNSFYDLHYSKKQLQDFPFFNNMQNTPMLNVDQIKMDYIKQLFEQIDNEHHSENILNASKIISLIDLIYLESTRMYLEKNESITIAESPYSDKFQKLLQLIENNYKTEKSPSAYANWLNVTSKHLNRITQNLVGKTTTDMILDRVFLEAKREMMNHKKNLNEIATDLGYDDYAYFSRIFKKKNGETPSSFIKHYQ